ncbi:tRNA glutamyl-Q(34) synthetase GluQRS [Accumulibacter sp.]|uniref:tRNA glutamyl-Q(34) synthetase GluQRS n=1 Tax=Accumulibacter sp. TaxID=2053492 RepID=UPI002C8E8B8C|nr:tRNA glutamyl-Q(34) synthetase GluQRS [Accumulibacter sp.]HPU78926.1 tRNA glutamyl-Q(34) synthetase GluQRS [Accumulibacter sp.]
MSLAPLLDGSDGGIYRGRFAPSPTGPLHFGSLVTAVGSYLDARAHAGEWLLRIEDVDQPRTLPGAADAILRTLEAFGFEWDGQVLFQSRRLDHYHAALNRLQLSGETYPCTCSRREIAMCSPSPSVDGGLVYPGICRDGQVAGRATRAWRMRVPDEVIGVADRVQGIVQQNLERAVGDFVLMRADGQFAYQLAVVVDDAAQGINVIVRGADLLDSTPRQVWLLQRLGLPTPAYAHLPVVNNATGEKLSKQTHAAAVLPSGGSALLSAAVHFLGHPVPGEMVGAPVPEFWDWAIANWSIERVPPLRGAFPGRR